jgi:hypothetical protein
VRLSPWSVHQLLEILRTVYFRPIQDISPQSFILYIFFDRPRMLARLSPAMAVSRQYCRRSTSGYSDQAFQLNEHESMVYSKQELGAFHVPLLFAYISFPRFYSLIYNMNTSLILAIPVLHFDGIRSDRKPASWRSHEKCTNGHKRLRKQLQTSNGTRQHRKSNHREGTKNRVVGPAIPTRA